MLTDAEKQEIAVSASLKNPAYSAAFAAAVAGGNVAYGGTVQFTSDERQMIEEAGAAMAALKVESEAQANAKLIAKYLADELEERGVLTSSGLAETLTGVAKTAQPKAVYS